MDVVRLKKVLARMPVRYPDYPERPHGKTIVCDTEEEKAHIQALVDQLKETKNVSILTAVENCTSAYGMTHGRLREGRTSGWDAVTYQYAITHGMS